MVSEHAGSPVTVVGHASTEGSDAYNLSRADHVAGAIRGRVSGANVGSSSVGEGAASAAESEQRNEAWRKVVVSVEAAPTGGR